MGFEQCAAVTVTLVVCFAVAIENPLREQACLVFVVLPDEEMIVIQHQAIGDDG